MTTAKGSIAAWFLSVTPANAYQRWKQCIEREQKGAKIPEGAWWALARAIDQAEREAIQGEPSSYAGAKVGVTR